MFLSFFSCKGCGDQSFSFTDFLSLPRLAVTLQGCKALRRHLSIALPVPNYPAKQQQSGVRESMRMILRERETKDNIKIGVGPGQSRYQRLLKVGLVGFGLDGLLTIIIVSQQHKLFKSISRFPSFTGQTTNQLFPANLLLLLILLSYNGAMRTGTGPRMKKSEN